MAALGQRNPRKKTSRKNRQNKVNLVFDEDERTNYLKGFRKRKNERRLKAKEELELRLKEEKKRIKEERKNVLTSMYYTNRDIPEVDHLVKPKIYELPNHTVTISSIADIDFQGKEDLLLGQNKADEKDSDVEGKVVKSKSFGDNRLTGSEEEEEEEKVEDECERTKKPEQVQLSNINRMLKRKSLSQMKKSKVMDATRRLQARKDRKKFHREKKAVFKKRAKLGKTSRNRGGKR